MLVMRHALAGSALLLLGFVASPVAVAIHGGADAADGAYSWMARLYHGDVSDPNNLICGGTLIAPTLVLSAGHCAPHAYNEIADTSLASNRPLADYRVLLGRADVVGTGGEVHAVTAVHVDLVPGHSPVPKGAIKEAHDVAVFVLDAPSSIAPVRLASHADEPLYPPGTPARVLGWGSTPDGTFPARMQQVDVPIWSDADCADPLARPIYAVFVHPATEICAGGVQGEDSCGGDSGGPLFVRDANAEPLQVGIVFYGTLLGGDGGISPCGDSVYPGVYTEVAAYRDEFQAIIDAQ